MTGRAIAAHYVRVMDKSVRECTKAVVDSVARRAVQVRCYMTERLAFADIAVMAGQAVAGICARMVKRRTGKVGSVMASGAVLVVGTGWYVVREFTDTNHIIVAGVTATHERRSDMLKGASAKGAWAMTNTTILSGRHVVERFTAGINTMAGRAIVHDARMIDECTSETIRVMTRSTIGRGSRVATHRRCFSGRVNTITSIVT